MGYENLDWQEGTKNLPGFKKIGYYIDKKQIIGWPTLNEKATTAAERVTYAGKFTLAADAKFKKLVLIQRKGSLTSEPQGEGESASVLVKLSAKHAGTKEEAVDLQMQGIRDDLLYIVKDMDNKYRVIGSEDFRTSTKVNIDLGGDATSEKGTTIEAECTDVCMPFYDNEILTDAGDVNPKPGA